MKIKLKTIIILITALMLGSIAQIILKLGANSIGQLNDLTSLLNAVFNPLVFTGIMLYFTSSLFWLVVLSKSELSYVYPFVAVTYIIVTLLSYLLLNESLPLLRITGIGVITGGVIMVSMSK